MKNKKVIIILSLMLLILMVTAVSATEDNVTDTVSTTDNLEINSVCMEYYTNDTISTIDNSDFSSENDVDDLEQVDDENTTFKNDVSSNVGLEQSQDVSNSLQNKEELLCVNNNNILISSNDDANDSSTNNRDNILGSTSNELLSENPNVTVIIRESDFLGYTSSYVHVDIELTSTNNYKWTISMCNGDWTSLDFNVDGYWISFYVGSLYNDLTGSFTTTGKSGSLYSTRGTSTFSSPCILPESVLKDTTVTVTNPSVKYNSGTFSVSGTVTDSDGNNVDGGTVDVTIGSTTKTSGTVSNGVWTASGFSSTDYGITTNQAISVSYSGTDGYEASTGSGTLTVNKNDPSVSFDSLPTVTYNGNTYTISGKVSVTGNTNVAAGSATVTLTVGSTSLGNVNVGTDGKWSKSGISSTLIAPSSGTVKVKYNGNTYYNAKETSSTITVNKNTPSLTINNVGDVTYNGNVYSISGTVTVTGNTNIQTSEGVSVTVNGQTFKGDMGSTGSWTINNIDSTLVNPTDSFSVTVTYTGNTYYNSKDGSKTFKIIKNTPTVTINDVDTVVYNGNSYTVSGYVNVNNNKNIQTTTGITVTVGSTDYHSDVGSDGSWSVLGIDSTLLAPGSPSITVKYIGNTWYNEKSETKTVSVNKNTPTVTVNDIGEFTYGGIPITITGTAKAQQSNNALQSGTITLTTNTGVILSGATSWSTDGTWTVSGIDSTLLDPATYTVTATYSNTNYNSVSNTGSLIVNPMNVTLTVTGNPDFKYNINNGQIINGIISNNINDKYGGYVNITIGSVLVASNIPVDSEGKWSFTNRDTDRFLPNTYAVTVNYSGNLYNKPTTGTGSYKVSKGDSILLISAYGDINRGDNKTIKVTVRDSKGFVENSKVVLTGTDVPANLYVITDENGEATFNVVLSTIGLYDDWVVSIEADERYDPLFSIYVNPFYVKDALNIIIDSVENYTSTYPDNIIIKGHVSSNARGSVNLTLGDKTVNTVLDASSYFTAVFSGVILGTYTSVSTLFIPDDSEYSYGGQLENIHVNPITVNKYSPIINIADVSVDYGLYPGNVSVTFKVNGAGNGRVPTGRVDALFEGKVWDYIMIGEDKTYTLHINNLPSGSFNINLKYYGDDYYKESSNYTSTVTINENSELIFIDNSYDVVSHSVVNVSSNVNDREFMVYLDGNYYNNIGC